MTTDARWSEAALVVTAAAVPCPGTKLTDGTDIGLPSGLAVQCIRAAHGTAGHEAFTVGPLGVKHSRWDDL